MVIDYDYEVFSHFGKMNIVADTLTSVRLVSLLGVVLVRSCTYFGASNYSKSWEVAVLFENAKCERVTGEMSTITEVSRVSVTLHSSVRSLFNR